MHRIATLCPFLLVAFAMSGQTDTTSPTVIKSAPQEMTTGTATAATPPAPQSYSITGDLTAPSAHPTCAGTAEMQASINCTAAEVLKLIRAKMKAAPPAEKPGYTDVLTVDLDVDMYGRVKSIHVDCIIDPKIPQAVILALYELPKFAPASNGAAHVPSHCHFIYPLDEVFAP